ncbi:MAG: hypothetical protein AUF65_02315 [Chloroflexi bacterium 13_1_20CM_50_12]|nr:MAG: hypothetical protein AUF65_02315 [Chloroflexi bacterium 13_1_20CM_50_12]
MVHPCVLRVLHPRQDFALGRCIALQLRSDDDARDRLSPFEELPEKSFACFFVAPPLYEDVEHVAVLIQRPPELVFVPANREDDLVQMPVVAATRMATTPFIRGGLPEGEAPLPNRFRGQDNPALCQRFFDRPEN